MRRRRPAPQKQVRVRVRGLQVYVHRRRRRQRERVELGLFQRPSNGVAGARPRSGFGMVRAQRSEVRGGARRRNFQRKGEIAGRARNAVYECLQRISPSAEDARGVQVSFAKPAGQYASGLARSAPEIHEIPRAAVAIRIKTEVHHRVRRQRERVVARVVARVRCGIAARRPLSVEEFVSARRSQIHLAGAEQVDLQRKGARRRRRLARRLYRPRPRADRPADE